MTILLLAPLAIAGGILLLPLLSELWSLLTPRSNPRSGAAPTGAESSRLLFLVPAHNEEKHIGPCVQALLRQAYPGDRRRVVVIADNSSDGTAAIARAEGAECLERADARLPGKPRALAWALEQLLADPWDACVIIDADTVVAADYARELARHSPLRGKAVQTYFGTLNERDTWLTRLAGVLTRCRYEVTYPLKARAALNCPLTGNGMSIGRELLEPQGWDAFSLTENWELFARYTSRGVVIDLAAGAKLFSQEASSMGQGQTQRKRWLAGRLGVLRSYGRAILGSRAIGPHQKLDALVELGGPSPVLHLTVAVLVAVAAGLTPGPEGRWIALVALLSLTHLVVPVIVVLARHPEPGRTLAAFAMLPAYAVWRVFVLIRTVMGRKDTTWRRTARE